MVFVPTRGDLPPRFGPNVKYVPEIGGSTLAADVYRDPARYELERSRVLNRSWQIICRSEQLKKPGDHQVWEGHGESVVITRRRDGGLAGFHNVCQHRGARIVRSCGEGARRFNCQWHNWAYDIEGNVAGIPDREDFEAEHIAGLRAPAIDVAEWGGWVWAVLAGPGVAGPLIDWIGPEIAADLGAYRMEDMVLHEKLTWEVDVNWKVVVDAFNELYHAQALHHIPPQDARDGRESTIDVFGRNGMMVVPFKGVLDELQRTLDHQSTAICHYTLFPTSVFNNNPYHIQLFRSVPLAVDRTRFETWELWYDSDEPAYVERTQKHWDHLKEVVAEDVDEWIDVAAVKNSSAYKQNIFNDHECKITHFHRVCEDMIQGGTGLVDGAS